MNNYFMPVKKSFFKTMLRTELLQWKLNHTPLWFVKRRNRLFRKIVAHIDGKPFCVYSPIHLQQGNNTYIGKNFYSGYNCVILDHGVVKIGDNVMLAPNVSILMVAHPLLAEQRIVRPFSNSFEPYGRGEIEITKPVTIGNNVWIATGSIVTGGVTIGDNSVIGAGSVVTRDIPPNTFACGVPCRVIRQITEDDRLDIDIIDT